MKLFPICSWLSGSFPANLLHSLTGKHPLCRSLWLGQESSSSPRSLYWQIESLISRHAAQLDIYSLRCKARRLLQQHFLDHLHCFINLILFQHFKNIELHHCHHCAIFDFFVSETQLFTFIVADAAPVHRYPADCRLCKNCHTCFSSSLRQMTRLLLDYYQIHSIFGCDFWIAMAVVADSACLDFHFSE